MSSGEFVPTVAGRKQPTMLLALVGENPLHVETLNDLPDIMARYIGMHDP
jgi:hypothetical protein